MGGASGGRDRGGEEAQALSPRSGDAGEAGPAGTGALCLARSEEQEEGGERQERGSGPAGMGRRPAGPVSAALGPGAEGAGGCGSPRPKGRPGLSLPLFFSLFFKQLLHFLFFFF